MDKTFNFDLLKRLCETPGIAGREDRIRNLIEHEIKGLFDEVRTDNLGNLICTRKARASKKGQKPLRVAVACHMDEIGFFVSHISPEGFLSIDPAGGFDARNLFSRRVLVCTEFGDLVGAMNPSGRPVHISSPDERGKVPELKSFYIDLGLSPDEVKKKVQIGDFVVMHEPTLDLGLKVMSKALDNRVACWLGIESIKALAKSKAAHACEVVVVFTAQEEVGIRGARTAAFQVNADVVIGLDVTLAVDTPGVPPQEACTIQGQGFGLHIKDSYYISDRKLLAELESIAKKRKIPYQRTLLAGGGQDAAGFQQTAAGARAIAVMVPTRYIHTVTEMTTKKDLLAARDVVAAYLAEAR